MVPVNEGPSEDHRRNMSLTYCPETDDDSFFTFHQVALIGIFNDRRIEKRSRFYRIFMGKIRPQEQFPVLVQVLVFKTRCFNTVYDSFAMPGQYLGNVPVPFGIFLQKRRNQ